MPNGYGMAAIDPRLIGKKLAAPPMAPRDATGNIAVAGTPGVTQQGIDAARSTAGYWDGMSGQFGAMSSDAGAAGQPTYSGASLYSGMMGREAGIRASGMQKLMNVADATKTSLGFVPAASAAHGIGAVVASPEAAASEHSPTATKLAIGEALTRLGNGVRRGEYQQPKSSLAIDQLRRAGLDETEIQILLKSGGE